MSPSIPVLLCEVKWFWHRLHLRMCVFCGDWVTRSNLCPLGTFSSEANDLALRLAWQYTGHKDIITLEKWVLLSPSSYDNSARVSFNQEKTGLPSMLGPMICVLLWSFFFLSFFAARTTATSRRSSTSAPTSTTSCRMVCGTHPCMWWVLFLALPGRLGTQLKHHDSPWWSQRECGVGIAVASPTLQVRVHTDVWVCHLSVHCGLTLNELAGWGFSMVNQQLRIRMSDAHSRWTKLASPS